MLLGAFFCQALQCFVTDVIRVPARHLCCVLVRLWGNPFSLGLQLKAYTAQAPEPTAAYTAQHKHTLPARFAS
jgi:hypothetical protein